MPYDDSTLARFWAKVNRAGDSDCWEWMGAKLQGYGLFRAKGQCRRAPRVSWQIAHGDIPDELHVCHRCDTPSCVNPAHLFLGTQADNMRDKVAKGRHPRGESSPVAKITEEDVRAIRRAYAAGATQYALADQYNLHQVQIGHIVTGERWAHVRMEDGSAGTFPAGTNRRRIAKLSDDIAARIRADYAAGGIKQKELGARYGVGQDVISRIVNNKVWK